MMGSTAATADPIEHRSTTSCRLDVDDDVTVSCRVLGASPIAFFQGQLPKNDFQYRQFTYVDLNVRTYCCERESFL
eukprot:6417241-Pyramimonas_sp.AAC.1